MNFNYSPNWYKLSARVCALKLIYRMCKNPKNGDIVATHLFKIYEKISNKRYFPDSLVIASLIYNVESTFYKFYL